MTPRTETSQGLIRRAYGTLSGSVATGWRTVVTYDFASGSFDEAVVDWSPGADWRLDFGLRKVQTAFEEHASSGDLKAIERSGVTRFFVDEDNGRRLGAAGYRLGVFAGGEWAQRDSGVLTWSAAVTNRERIETWEEVAGGGDRASRGAALWGTFGWRRQLNSVASWQAGFGLGWMPVVSSASGLGERPELTIGSVHFEWRGSGWSMLAETLGARVAAARGDRAQMRPRGGFLQSSFTVGGGREVVVRFSWLDAGGRGIRVSDVIRSAPSNEILNDFVEGYAGLNWYLRGNDLKLQIGGVWARLHDDLSGRGLEERVLGGRTQLQVQF